MMNLTNARVSHQLEQMKKIAARGICPFCPKYFSEYHEAPILYSTKSWIITKNDYPYEGATGHWLIVSKKHVKNINSLPKGAVEEIRFLTSWLEKKYNFKGASLLMRFGDIKYTGATISHLHAHVIVGRRQTKTTESLKVKVGFKKKNASKS